MNVFGFLKMRGTLRSPINAAPPPPPPRLFFLKKKSDLPPPAVIRTPRLLKLNSVKGTLVFEIQ